MNKLFPKRELFLRGEKRMEIPCNQSCPYNDNGICKKDNCICETGYLSATTGCPFNAFSFQQASTDRTRSVSDKALSVLCAF